MPVRERIIQLLETSIKETIDKIEELTILCEKHDLRDHPEADACPCQAELFWKLDVLDESVYRLTTLEHTIIRWCIWYDLCSITSPGFPRESIDVWTQTEQPIAAWQKYGVAKRNGEVSVNDRRGYVYYKNSREDSARPAASNGMLEI